MFLCDRELLIELDETWEKHDVYITCVQRAVSVGVFLSPVHAHIVFIDDVTYGPRREITYLSHY